ncbi:hypothetical protein, partial [Methylomonas koyamae]|uniref:hypothetical protein n=1 Tax=Methylomonas koyamae TaxID=702114 RepID=UPI00211074D7
RGGNGWQAHAAATSQAQSFKFEAGFRSNGMRRLMAVENGMAGPLHAGPRQLRRFKIRNPHRRSKK